MSGYEIKESSKGKREIHKDGKLVATVICPQIIDTKKAFRHKARNTDKAGKAKPYDYANGLVTLTDSLVERLSSQSKRTPLDGAHRYTSNLTDGTFSVLVKHVAVHRAFDILPAANDGPVSPALMHDLICALRGEATPALNRGVTGKQTRRHQPASAL